MPATKLILVYSLNLRSAGFHRITHKRKSTTRTPTAWQRTSSTSWWNSNFPSNFLLGLSFPSLIPILQVALYAFKAQADTELSFSKGDRLEVTLKQFTRYHESRLVYLQIFSGSRQTCIWPRMVQGKKPDGPGGDPSIVIIKFTFACRCKDQQLEPRWVWCRRTTCRSSPSSSPRTCKVEGTARMHRWGKLFCSLTILCSGDQWSSNKWQRST